MSKKTYSSVFRLRKLKTAEQILGAGEHNDRTKQPPNADPSRKPGNPLIGAGKTTLELVNQRLKECGITPRKNAVLAYEIIVSAGPKFFKNLNPEQRQQWTTQALDFIKKTFTAENVVHAIVHDDETTPHLHSIVVPIRSKKRKWKLDSKGFLEQFADQRPKGPLDRAAAKFRLSDLIKPAKLIARLTARKTKHTSPVTTFLAGKFSPESLAVLRDRKAKLPAKRKVLVAELNRVLAQATPVYDPTAFADVQLSPTTQQLLNSNPQGDDRYRLNRHLLHDAFTGCFQPLMPRPIGSPTYPFMHQLQKDYFDLCQAFDPEISEPMYRAKMSHTVLAEFYQRLEQAVKDGKQLLDEIAVTPPSPLDAANPREFADRESQRIRSLIEPLLAKAQEATLLRAEVEKTKNAVHLVNQSYAPEQNVLQAENTRLHTENDSLKRQNADLLKRLRAIPLDKVMQQLAFPLPVPGQANQFRLPDERVIEIDGHNFRETTGAYGLGAMHKRQSAKGAVDLVMFITGWELSETQRWLQLHFGLEAAVTTYAEIVKTDLTEALQKPAPPAVIQTINEPAAIYYRPDPTLWPALKNLLTNKHRLPPRVLDDLHQQKKIHANQFGSLVGQQFDSTGNLAAVVIQPMKTGAGSIIELAVQPDHAFELGPQSAERILLTPSITDAIAAYTRNENSRILPVRLIPPVAVMRSLAQHVRRIQQSVLLVGDAWSRQMITRLQHAGIPTQFQNVQHAPTLSDIDGQIWQPAPEKWPSLYQRLVENFALNGNALNTLNTQRLIWSTAAFQLAAVRTALEDRERRGVTLVHTFQTVVSSTALASSQGGFFWCETPWADSDTVVILANPLEALSYQSLLYKRQPSVGHEPAPNKLPLLISVDAELPPPELVQRVIKAKKKLVLATHSPLVGEQLAKALPELLVQGQLYIALTFDYASGQRPEKFEPDLWNIQLIEMGQVKSPPVQAKSR